MTDTKLMTQLELIQLIGDVITEVDVVRSTFGRETTNRTSLDDIRDELDTYQRKLVRSVISDNTKPFKELTTSLKEVNKNLQQTIEDVDKVAHTLETLVKFAEVVRKSAELIP